MGRTALDACDTERLDRIVELISQGDEVSIVATVLPDAAEDLMSRCELDHVALLVFPPCHADLVSELDERGFSCGAIVPSTVVRERIRNRLESAAAPEVSIVHATTVLPDGARRELEVFLAPQNLTDVAERERHEEVEAHIAVTPRSIDEAVVRDLSTLLRDSGLVADGGGFNPHENRTVLYFRRLGRTGAIHRLELVCPAHFPRIVEDHLGDRIDGSPMKALSNPGADSAELEDIPGTVVFTAARSRQGYPLNRFCMSLIEPENRVRFFADEAAYLREWPMSDAQKRAVLDRDYPAAITHGGHIYFLAKLFRADGKTFQEIAAQMTGMTPDGYGAMMLAGGRSPEGWRSVKDRH